MTTDPQLVDVIEFVLQWAALPICGLLWWVMQQIAALEKQIIRLVTLYDARVTQRIEDREVQNRINTELLSAVEKLGTRMDEWTTAVSRLAAAHNKV